MQSAVHASKLPASLRGHVTVHFHLIRLAVGYQSVNTRLGFGPGLEELKARGERLGGRKRASFEPVDLSHLIRVPAAEGMRRVQCEHVRLSSTTYDCKKFSDAVRAAVHSFCKSSCSC